MASLATITDFDFGAGEEYSESQRVRISPCDVSKPERDFIMWVMLHQEFYRAKCLSKLTPTCVRSTIRADGRFVQRNDRRTQTDGNLIEDDNGNEGLYSSILNNERFNAEALQIAKEYAEQTLHRYAKENVILEDLSESERDNILIQLCRSCDLKPGTSISSAPDIFRQLRASKFFTAFNVKKIIGKGSSGEVYHVVPTGNLNSEEYAVKKTSVSFFNIEDEVKSALNESKFLKILSGHENIVKLYDYWLEIENSEDDISSVHSDDDEPHEGYIGPLKFYIQLEYCYISLEKWKEQVLEYQIPEVAEVLQISCQLIGAIAYIHQKGIMHLDINPRNILWKDASHRQIKIVDFGLAVREDFVNYKCGTFPYVAPEQKLIPKSDIYSAAVTIVDISRSVRTVQELCDIIESKAVAVGNLHLDELVVKSLNPEPSLRPTAREFKSGLARFDNE